MEQDDIFKLLLIILLLSNEKENCVESANNRRYSNLNEIIITVLLFNAFTYPAETPVSLFNPDTTF